MRLPKGCGVSAGRLYGAIKPVWTHAGSFGAGPFGAGEPPIVFVTDLTAILEPLDQMALTRYSVPPVPGSASGSVAG